MMSRNQEQEKVLLVLYEYLFYQKMGSNKEVQKMIEDVLECPYDEASIFVKEVVIKAVINQKSSDELIIANLKDWKLERLNIVCHAILLSAITQSILIKEIDRAAMIDIAVSFTKKYCDEKDYKFVNGILDNIL